MHPRRLKSPPIEVLANCLRIYYVVRGHLLPIRGRRGAKLALVRVPHEGGDGQQRWFLWSLKGFEEPLEICEVGEEGSQTEAAAR
jgi:hypothetical protein